MHHFSHIPTLDLGVCNEASQRILENLSQAADWGSNTGQLGWPQAMVLGLHNPFEQLVLGDCNLGLEWQR